MLADYDCLHEYIITQLFLYVISLVAVVAHVVRCYDCRINEFIVHMYYPNEIKDTNKLFVYFVLSHLFAFIIIPMIKLIAVHDTLSDKSYC